MAYKQDGNQEEKSPQGVDLKDKCMGPIFCQNGLEWKFWLLCWVGILNLIDYYSSFIYIGFWMNPAWQRLGKF